MHQALFPIPRRMASNPPPPPPPQHDNNYESKFLLSRRQVFGCCLVQALQNSALVCVHSSLFFSSGYTTVGKKRIDLIHSDCNALCVSLDRYCYITWLLQFKGYVLNSAWVKSPMCVCVCVCVGVRVCVCVCVCVCMCVCVCGIYPVSRITYFCLYTCTCT